MSAGVSRGPEVVRGLCRSLGDPSHKAANLITITPMPDAPRKYFLITDEQMQAARKIWPQINPRTYVLVLKRSDEPMVLNKAPHRGIGFMSVTVPEPDRTV